MVEPDTAKTNGGFIFAAGRGNDDDGMRAIEQSAGPGGVLAGKAYINAAREMR